MCSWPSWSSCECGQNEGGLVGRVNAGVTRLADTLVLGQPQAVRHGLVHPNDPVLGVHNGDQVGHGVEGAIPPGGFLEGRAADCGRSAAGRSGGGRPLLWAAGRGLEAALSRFLAVMAQAFQPVRVAQCRVRSLRKGYVRGPPQPVIIRPLASSANAIYTSDGGVF